MKKSDYVFMMLMVLTVIVVILILVEPSGGGLKIPGIHYSTKSHGYNEQTGKWIAIKVDSNGFVILPKEKSNSKAE